jgi:hypothetical protein
VHRSRLHRLARPLALVVCCMLLTLPARAQTSADTDQPDPELIERTTTEAIEAFAAGRLDDASAKLDQLIAWEPANFVHYYNLACVKSLRGEGEAAAELIVQAVERGFTDVGLLGRDPALATARATPTMQNLLDNWEQILERRIDTDLDRAREKYGGRYWYVKEPDLRLAYACAYDQDTLDQTRDEVRRLYAWAMDNIFGDTDDTLAGPEDAWVLVVLPNQKDFRLWAAENYGPAARSLTQAIGGHYAHDEKQLVTMDLGATTRHEFLHVLHWRSNTRHGQLHPIWVQEGLCSLIEDYDLGEGDELIPVESWRTNQAKFLADTGHLLKIEDLCALSRDRFTNSRPLAMYAQARVLFLFLYREGKLREWYTHFTEHFREDPSGLASIDAVLDGDLEEINERYAQFCKNLPEVPEEVGRGMASLGIEIDATGTGEGLRVASQVRRGTAGDLRLNDIITHIEDRPVRDYWELVRVLTSYEPGQTVKVNYRRVRLHQETEIVLKAAQ